MKKTYINYWSYWINYHQVTEGGPNNIPKMAFRTTHSWTTHWNVFYRSLIKSLYLWVKFRIPSSSWFLNSRSLLIISYNCFSKWHYYFMHQYLCQWHPADGDVMTFIGVFYQFPLSTFFLSTNNFILFGVLHIIFCRGKRILQALPLWAE